jgi:hypothetical protein
MSSPVNPTSLRFQTFCDNNDLPARSRTSMDTRTGRIPDDVNTPTMTAANELRPSSSDGKLQCCCGRLECAYLENNSAILGGIERDLETAARLGQVCAPSQLVRVSEKVIFCRLLVIAPGGHTMPRQCGDFWEGTFKSHRYYLHSSFLPLMSHPWLRRGSTRPDGVPCSHIKSP